MSHLIDITIIDIIRNKIGQKFKVPLTVVVSLPIILITIEVD